VVVDFSSIDVTWVSILLSVLQFCVESTVGHHVFLTTYKVLTEDFEYFKNIDWKCLILDDVCCIIYFLVSLTIVTSVIGFVRDNRYLIRLFLLFT
jgi:hypothetical protein